MSDSIDKELEKITSQHGFLRPDRGNLDDSNIQWREGKPDYRTADLTFFKGRSKNHPSGSLEMIVENLVKTWEMEMTHKTDPQQWTTVKVDEYRVQVNGGQEISGHDAAKVGTYNWILENTSTDLYDATRHTFESSHQEFRGAFMDGFGWELLEVFSGPPRVAFTWRHWGKFNGKYEGVQGTDEIIEMYGFTIATVNYDLKILKIEVFAKFDGFLKAILGKVSPADLEKGKELLGSCCPIHKTVRH